MKGNESESSQRYAGTPVVFGNIQREVMEDETSWKTLCIAAMEKTKMTDIQKAILDSVKPSNAIVSVLIEQNTNERETCKWFSAKASVCCDISDGKNVSYV